MQIQTFVEVAHAGSFSEAAKRMDLPRSTVTARIRALETRLNTRLLQRTTRVVTVTDDGKRYLDACERALTTLGEVEYDLLSKHVLRGIIRLSVPTDFYLDLLAQILGEFSNLHNDIQITVDVSDQAIQLIEDRFDLALRGRDPGLSGLVARKIFSAPLGLYVAKKIINIESLPLLDPLQLTEIPKSALHSSITTHSLALTKHLAIAALVTAVLPDSLCIKDVSSGHLRRIGTPTGKESLDIFLVYPSRHHLPVRVRTLLDFLVLKLRQELVQPS